MVGGVWLLICLMGGCTIAAVWLGDEEDSLVGEPTAVGENKNLSEAGLEGDIETVDDEDEEEALSAAEKPEELRSGDDGELCKVAISSRVHSPCSVFISGNISSHLGLSLVYTEDLIAIAFWLASLISVAATPIPLSIFLILFTTLPLIDQRFS